MTIKLGIIGFSVGNGHPYSFSAIINGYNSRLMRDCGFPVIPKYLAKQEWPRVQIKGAQMTHIWTQDKKISKKIARAALIPNISQKITELIDNVDAVILARDDAVNNHKHADYCLKSGKPIFIDKPIAYNVKSLKKLYDAQKFEGQITTGTAFRFAKEFKLSKKISKEIGKIHTIVAISPKSWSNYSVHIIEPVIKMLNKKDFPILYKKLHGNKNGGGLSIKWNSNINTHLICTGDSNANFVINVFGTKSNKTLILKDTFTAFRYNLMDFIKKIRLQRFSNDRKYQEQVVKIIERGCK